MFTEKQLRILDCALSYARANLDDLKEAVGDDDDEANEKTNNPLGDVTEGDLDQLVQTIFG
jgi:hypothetical protein